LRFVLWIIVRARLKIKIKKYMNFLLCCYGSGKKGGALASAVHSYLNHGDPAVQALVRHLLAVVSTWLTIVS
jgi:hypothetical protein